MRSSRPAAWLMLAPALALFAGIAVLPLGELLAMSVSRIDWIEGKARWSFVGTDQYVQVLRDALFRAGIVNTLVFAVAAVAAQMVLGFFLALMTTRIARGRVAYRTVFILPILVPGIVVGAIWKLMYNFDFGVLNQMLGALGLPAVEWLGNASTALLAVVAVDVWHWTPFVFLLMLAGLESLPQDVYEAARVDGATFGQELRYVTLPLMLPVIVVTFVFRVIVGVKVFDEIYLLTGGGPGTATTLLSFQIWKESFSMYDFGAGSAVAFIVVLISVLFIVAITKAIPSDLFADR